jgi:hypothetical protein
MAFKRWGCEFDGPWPGTQILKSRKGIWVIWRKLGFQWDVIAVGESNNVAVSLSKPEAQPVLPAGRGAVYYSATYTPRLSANARRELAQHIRKVSDHR